MDAACWRLPLGACPAIRQLYMRSLHPLQPVERYRLDRFWCLNLYQGHGELRIAGQVYEFHPGFAGITGPGVDLEYRFRDTAVVHWAHFYPARVAPAASIPVMQDLGRDFPRVRDALAEAAMHWRFCPARAAARVWDLLWDLALRGAPPRPELHPALRQAMILIDERLAEPLVASELARAVGVSHTHLNRLFRAAHGQAIVGYIRSQRMERAVHMLQHTTLPVRAVARQVGIADLQWFNKTVRRMAGRSPRKLREAPRDRGGAR